MNQIKSYIINYNIYIVLNHNIEKFLNCLTLILQITSKIIQ